MYNRSMGETISALRKELGMTQNELAEKMSVTDKAVSKWERDLSCPDINSLPRLAEILGISVEELLNAETGKRRAEAKTGGLSGMVDTVLLGVGLAAGIATGVTAVLRQIETDSALVLLAIGLSCFGIYLLKHKDRK